MNSSKLSNDSYSPPLLPEILSEKARRRDELRRSFPTDPVGYAEKVLEVTPWEAQKEAARAILQYPHRVLVKSGHNIGKSFLAAWLINWHFDSFQPGVTISTAPTHRDVCDILWKEVRMQR